MCLNSIKLCPMINGLCYPYFLVNIGPDHPWSALSTWRETRLRRQPDRAWIKCSYLYRMYYSVCYSLLLKGEATKETAWSSFMEALCILAPNRTLSNVGYFQSSTCKSSRYYCSADVNLVWVYMKFHPYDGGHVWSCYKVEEDFIHDRCMNCRNTTAF